MRQPSNFLLRAATERLPAADVAPAPPGDPLAPVRRALTAILAAAESSHAADRAAHKRARLLLEALVPFDLPLSMAVNFLNVLPVFNDRDRRVVRLVHAALQR